MCIYVYMYICTCVYIYIYIYIHIQLYNIGSRICMTTMTCYSAHAYIHQVRTHACAYVHKYMHVVKYMFLCIYMQVPSFDTARTSVPQHPFSATLA